MTVDEISDLYQRIGSVMQKYTFTYPVETCDIDYVCSDLQSVVPGFTASVRLFAGDRVIVKVQKGDEVYYHRTMLVEGAP